MDKTDGSATKEAQSKENNDRKHDHKFNYEPIDSIRNQMPDSICISSNKIIYHKKIIGVDILEAVGDDDDDNDENNACYLYQNWRE